MKPLAIFFALLSMVVATTADAKEPTRALMHTFQDGSALIVVAIVDHAPAPQGVVKSADPARQRTFSVSRQQFEQMWRTLESLPQKYAGSGGASRSFDAASNFIFSMGYMPNGKKTNYVIPKSSAFSPLVALARQLEAYAR